MVYLWALARALIQFFQCYPSLFRKQISQLLHVLRPMRLPSHAASVLRMIDFQIMRVKCYSWRSTHVWVGSGMQAAIVDGLSAERCSCLTQVNTDLVCAASFKLAFNPTEAVESLYQAHMRDSMAGIGALFARSTAAVATVCNEMRCNTAGLGNASGKAPVPSANGVVAKLLSYRFGGVWIERQHHYSASFIVEPMQRPQARQGRSRPV